MNTLKNVCRNSAKAKAIIESLRDEVKAMNTNFKKREADISIVKNVSSLLMKKSVEIEWEWSRVEYLHLNLNITLKKKSVIYFRL